MANPDVPNGFRPVGKEPKIGYYPIAASQTYVYGDMLVRSAGQVTRATAASAILLGAAADAQTTPAANTMIPVYDDPNQEYIGQCSGTVQDSELPKTCDIEGTSGIMEIDENAVATNVIRIERRHPDSENNVANAKVFFRINIHENEV